MATTATRQAPQAPERSYHDREDAAYVLPNDAAEHVRLETQHRHLSAIMNNQPIHAPISPSAQNLRILDVGCGTGIVSDYLASRFSSSEVFGVDLTPVPQLRSHPSNVHFLQGNVLSDPPSKWADRNGKTPLLDGQGLFDLIFSRLLVCGMSDWPGYISKAHELLKPGGFIEIQDVDFRWLDASDNSLSDSWPWWQKVRAAGESTGLDWDCAKHAAQRLKDAGFVDVKVTTYRWPWGGQWEKDPVWRDFGEYVAKEIAKLNDTMFKRLLGKVGYGAEEVRKLGEEASKNLGAEAGKHWVMYVTVGRKPE